MTRVVLSLAPHVSEIVRMASEGVLLEWMLAQVVAATLLPPRRSTSSLIRLQYPPSLAGMRNIGHVALYEGDTQWSSQPQLQPRSPQRRLSARRAAAEAPEAPLWLPRWLRRLRKSPLARTLMILSFLGPGLIAANARNDAGAGAVAAWSNIGARYGYELLW